jgi:ABC-type glycerol-3-phosphate transport system substrate-binding protein
MKDLVLGSATDYWTWKGQIYGIGNEVNACTLAYRKSAFDEIGVATPFKTWQDFMEASQKLKKEKDMAGITFHDLSDGDFQMMLFNAGGQMFEEDGSFGGLNDMGKQILQYQQQMLKDGTAIPAPATGDSTWGSPDYWEVYRKDKVAAVLGAPWWNGKLGNDTNIGPGPQEKQWRLQALPGGIGKGIPTATHGGTSVSIPKGAAHKDEAWAVIEESHLTKAVLEDVKERGIVPSYIPAIEDPILHEPYAFYDGQVIGDLYLELAKQMPRIHQSPWAPEIHTAFTNIVITPVLQQNADIDKAFADCTTEIKRIMSA